MTKLNFIREKTFREEIHRAGWNWVTKSLVNKFHSDKADIIVDEFIERPFDWEYTFNNVDVASLLNKINFQAPSYFIISNFSAKETNDSKIIFIYLTKQMSNKVRWVESVQLLNKLKESSIIEIGPSKVLSGLIKKLYQV